MPSYVIAKSLGRTGETIEATMCDLTVVGSPDRRTDVSVRVQHLSEQLLSIDGEPRRIISSERVNTTTTFLVDGSSRGLRNRERRVALTRALGLLQQLTACLRPLTAESAEPEPVAEGLQFLFDWIREERERATTMPRLIDASKGGPDDHASR